MLGFFATEGAVSTDTGDTYLSCYPDTLSNVYILYVISNDVLGRYFNACNDLVQNSNIRKYGLVLEKYQSIKSGYFQKWDYISVGYGDNILCNGISEKNRDKNVPL